MSPEERELEEARPMIEHMLQNALLSAGMREVKWENVYAYPQDPMYADLNGRVKMVTRQLDDLLEEANENFPLPKGSGWAISQDNQLMILPASEEETEKIVGLAPDDAKSMFSIQAVEGPEVFKAGSTRLVDAGEINYGDEDELDEEVG